MKLNDFRLKPGTAPHLADRDPHDTSLVKGGKSAAKEQEADFRERIDELQEILFAEHRHKILIVLQGMDTSGKDGTVRHVMAGANPQGVTVSSFKKPSPDELAHDFLWRIHQKTPGTGAIAIFNRSHYEDVLVVRVHELVPEKIWRRRYDEINEFERTLADAGTLILKFFLHISPEEQKKRLQKRLDDPKKRWKFERGDLAERKLWSQYQAAYEEALEKTSTDWAPWWIVPADAKWFRNHVVARVLVEAMKKLDMKYPQPDLSHVTID